MRHAWAKVVNKYQLVPPIGLFAGSLTDSILVADVLVAVNTAAFTLKSSPFTTAPG